MEKKHPYHDQSMWKGASSELFDMARILRKNMTEAEIKLWDNLKGNKLRGLKFRPQHPIYLFIVDFYCHRLKLVIEVDGGYHEDENQKVLDIERSHALKELGIHIIRYTNSEILNDLEKVLDKINSEINFLLRP
jgi:very-short-patch-repair endonuclease